VDVFIIFTPTVLETKLSAERSLVTFGKYKGWSPHLAPGCDPTTLGQYERNHPLSNERGRYQPTDAQFNSKKSCFYSHFELWKRCIQLNQSIVIIEYDTHCGGDYPLGLDTHGGVVHLALDSVLASSPVCKTWQQVHKKLDLTKQGIFPIISPIQRDGHLIMPSNAAYQISPNVARWLVEDCNKHGWQQNDILMSTKNFNISYVMPSPIIYDVSQDKHTSRVKS
jgi:Glycosyltransferase family 25 (LPS biosynthesis protein)